MYKKIIFVDLENIQQMDKTIITSKTKVFIMVGLNQNKTAFDLVNKIFEKVAAIELIKTNGSGHNALDSFIAFYMGKYYNKIKDKEIVICSKDGGYDPLIKHLDGYNISINRKGLNNSIKNEGVKIKKAPQTQKSKKEESIKKTTPTKELKEICDHFTSKDKNLRPRKLGTLRSYLLTNLKKKKVTEDNVDKMILLMEDNNIIEVTDKRKGTIKYLI